ncbi:MAG: hypothetical protein IKV54_06230 [Clostridia bacterium]|nr:hypothetical protein [Clostridia bacterium]
MGKYNLVIFGDSYSTHKDYIPDGYEYYYSVEGLDPASVVNEMSHDKTWWWRFAERTDAEIIRNDSWSGSTIGYTGYDGDCSTTSSFICRYRKLRKEGLFTENKIDTVIVFGGTNDSWSDAPLGEDQFSDWTEEDLFRVRPAICYFMDCLKKDNPDTRIVFILNSELKEEINECMRNAAAHIGAELIELSDIEKMDGHPTVLGMQQICEQVLAKYL